MKTNVAAIERRVETFRSLCVSLLTVLILALGATYAPVSMAGSSDSVKCDDYEKADSSSSKKVKPGCEFAGLTGWMKSMIGGSLGKVIAIGALLIGGIMGAAKMSGMPMGAAFLIAIMLVFGVKIIENIIGAVI